MLDFKLILKIKLIL